MKNELYPPEGFLSRPGYTRELCALPHDLERAREDGVIMEGKAFRCSEDHDLFVRLPGGGTGMIPYSECVSDAVKESAREIAVLSRVGKYVCFKVTDTSGAFPLLSRKAAQEEAQEKCVAFLEPGDIIDAVVTHLEPFGAFCDIGCGIISLLPIDSMSVSRIAHPRDRFYTGQRIKAVIRNSCDGDGRVSLTHKELLGTWEENAAQFAPGQAVTGTVRSVEKYGVFVELTPNLAGLAEYTEGVDAGDTVSVFIKSIIPQKMKVKLVIIDKAERETPEREYDYRYTHGTLCRWTYSPAECPRVIESVFQYTKSNWIP
ncbi:MAG: S1 RNA-binding domain-containing protein [Clostridia bacterium]|nr:S1 RNA-binding domain-containing protein [Clostridia bacterium]